MKKLITLFLALTMLVSVAGIAFAAEVPEGYPALILDKDGKTVDLGGIEVIIADWWSPADGAVGEPTNSQQEAQQEYREWMQKTYNFTVKQLGISDWATNPETFLNFAQTGGEENYAWIYRQDSIAAPMNSGLFYDLATLDCLDFTNPMFNPGTTQTMTKGDSIYGTSFWVSQPRQVVFFNKRLVEEAGIDPESIYDLQINNEWTWDKFIDMMKTCQRDTDNDGVIDVYGMASKSSDFYFGAVFSNDATFFDNVDGKYVSTMQSDATLEALNWATENWIQYQMPQPEGSSWDYFVPAFTSGLAAFHVGQEYQAEGTGVMTTMEDDFGMVAFPTGPSNEKGNYKTVADENVWVIPNVYEPERAWKIAFVMQLWNTETPGYTSEEEPDAWKGGFYNTYRDDRAVDESLAILRDPAHVASTVTRVFDTDDNVFGPDFIWSLTGGAVTVAEAIETKTPAWQTYLDIANGITKAE